MSESQIPRGLLSIILVLFERRRREIIRLFDDQGWLPAFQNLPGLGDDGDVIATPEFGRIAGPKLQARADCCARYC